MSEPSGSGKEYLLPPGDARNNARKRALIRVEAALDQRRAQRDRSDFTARWLGVGFATLATLVLLALVHAVRAEGASYHETISRDKAKTWQVVSRIFGPYGTAGKAFRVAGCETGGRYNRGAYNSRGRFLGLFQIHLDSWVGRTIYWRGMPLKVKGGNLHGRYPNARVALWLSKGGTDWSPWPVCGRR